jgi:acyl-CoA dehydrogenase
MLDMRSETVTENVSPFNEAEEAFRKKVREFLDRELEPNAEKFFDTQGYNVEYDRTFWRRAGEAGILGSCIPSEYGGPGLSDMCNVVIAQEMGRSIGGVTVGSSIQGDIAAFIFMKGASKELKHKWSPAIISGKTVASLAVTEESAGSDATAVKTTAIRDGEHYVVNGSKRYVSTGNVAHLHFVVVKTDPAKRGAGTSMIMIESDMPGFHRHPMKTMGYPGMDLAEFKFDSIRVPAGNLFLGEGRGIEILLSTFALDRLGLSARALYEAELAFRLALDYVRRREAFGQPLFDFQNTRFKLAEMKTEIEAGRSFLYNAVRKHRAGEFRFVDGAMAKLWLPEMATRVVDKAFQMFGGAGFMDETPISKIYRANRVHRIHAGTAELQRVAIAKAL